MMRILGFALAWFLATIAATKLVAEPHNYQAVLSDAVSVQMEFATDYEFAHQRELPFYFSVQVPLNEEGVKMRRRFPKTGNMGELVFAAPDGTFLEYVTISAGTVPAGPLDEKLNIVFSIIEAQVYPSLQLGDDAQVLGGRRSEIRGHPAVEYVALASDPANGPLAARIVGVLAPNETDVLFFVQQTMRERMGLTGPDALSETYAGTILSSLAFDGYRDATGAVVAY